MKDKVLSVIEVRPGSLRVKDGVVVAVEVLKKYAIKAELGKPALPEAAAQHPEIDTITPAIT